MATCATVGHIVDRIEQLIAAFGARRHTAWKLDVLLDLERLRDPRVVPFLLRVLADPGQPHEVRLAALKRVRHAYLGPDERPPVAGVLVRLVSQPTTEPSLRVQATLALGDFVDLDGVAAALGCLALDGALPIDLRYAAFTALERAGPTPECLTLLRRLRTDDTLGRLATHALAVWQHT